MLNLSATVIVLNEEKNIKRCLDSLKDWVDEMIVVDGGSTDQTIKIAKQLGAKVYVRKFDNFASQKNYAVSKANGKWIFAIDADEVVSDQLAKEIESVLDQAEFVGFLIPRRNFIFGGEIKYTRFSPDKHIWLWQKDKGKWQGDVHEEVVVTGPVGQLKTAKLHYQDKTISQFIASNNHYSQLEAAQMFKEHKKFSYWKMHVDYLKEFLIRFFYKMGFRDGWRGLVLSYLVAYYRQSVWLKLLELEKNKS